MEEMSEQMQAAALEGWKANPIVRSMEALARELTTVTGEPYERVYALVEAGAGRGWTRDEVRQHAIEALPGR